MICAARELLPEVKVGKEFLRLSAEICIECGTDGHRADIGMIKTARTLAALSGRKKVQREDIEKAAYYVLPHRMRKILWTVEIWIRMRSNRSLAERESREIRRNQSVLRRETR